MADYYNQGVKVPVWVVLNELPADLAKEIEYALRADGAFVLEWPAHSFLSTIAQMGKQGWRHITTKAKPFTVDVNFVSVAAVKHVKACFGPNTMLTGSHSRPYQQSLNRVIETEDDWRRLFDEILSLEKDTELSHVFQMSAKRSAVYVSRTPIPADVITKLSKNILTVGEQNCTISTKDLTADEIVQAVQSEIDSLLNI